VIRADYLLSFSL